VPGGHQDFEVILFVWWLAIISVTGELQYLEYRTKESCKLVERLYQASGVKTTVCIEKTHAEHLNQAS
jgi:hypothetical protein